MNKLTLAAIAVAGVVLAACTGVPTPNTYEYGICGYEETTGDPEMIIGKDGSANYVNNQSTVRTPIPCEPPVDPQCTVDCDPVEPPCTDCEPVCEVDCEPVCEVDCVEVCTVDCEEEVEKQQCDNGHGNLDDCLPGYSYKNNAENSDNSGEGNSGNGGGGHTFNPPADDSLEGGKTAKTGGKPNDNPNAAFNQ